MTDFSTLRMLAKERADYIRTNNQIENRMCAIVRTCLGYQVTNAGKMTKTESQHNEPIKKEARALVRKLIDGKPFSQKEQEQISSLKQLIVFKDMYLLGKAARDSVEKKLEKMARTLPGYAFAKSVSGYGDLTHAIIIGSSGDPADYKSWKHFAKRFGMVPFTTTLGATGAPSNNSKNDASTQDHIRCGYNKPRRADVYACLEQNLMKHQIIGKAKSGEPYGAAKGPYGQIYIDRRFATQDTRPDWSLKRKQMDASRIMAQRVLRDLYFACVREQEASELSIAA